MRWKCRRAHPGRLAIVKPVDPDDAAVADVVADWKKTPGTVGIRIMMTKEAGREPTDPGLDRILRAAVRHDFPVNMLCWGNLDAGMAIVDRHPETRFIIDHLAILQPRVPPAPPQPWADLPKVLELAKRPNAVIKVSGACTLSREPYPFPDIWDPLARVFDAWGFDRCLWGTDWTRAFAVVNYEQAVKPFLETNRLSDAERAMLMGGACAKAYRLVADQGLGLNWRQVLREATGSSQAEVCCRRAKKAPGPKPIFYCDWCRFSPRGLRAGAGVWAVAVVRRRNGDLRAAKSALQRRDARGVVAFLAVFHRHSGFQGPGITIRVVARQQAEKLLAPRHGVLACRLCGKSALGRS